MTLPRRLFSAPSLPTLRLNKAYAEPSPEAILVYPGPDLQGDVIEPEGGDWGEFERLGRLVNYEHGPHIGTGEIAYKSIPLEDGTEAVVPVGTPTFFTKAADVRGLRLPRYDERGNVVGRYTADECLRYAEQVAPLVYDGTLNGVSVEFRPAGLEGVTHKSRGKSEMLSRDAYHFYRWNGLGYAAACHQPVNNNARYFIEDGANYARGEKAFKLVFEDAGKTLDLVRKSFRPLAELFRDTRRKVVPVRITKADPVDEMPPDMGAGDMAPPVDDGMGDAPAMPPPTVQASIDYPQAVRDARAAAESLLASSEALGEKKKILAEMDKIDACLNKIQAIGEALAGKLKTGDDSPTEVPDDAPEPETDESGTIVSKAFPRYIPAPRRLRKGDARPVARKPKDEAGEVAAIREQIAALKQKVGLN